MILESEAAISGSGSKDSAEKLIPLIESLSSSSSSIESCPTSPNLFKEAEAKSPERYKDCPVEFKVFNKLLVVAIILSKVSKLEDTSLIANKYCISSTSYSE